MSSLLHPQYAEYPSRPWGPVLPTESKKRAKSGGQSKCCLYTIILLLLILVLGLVIGLIYCVLRLRSLEDKQDPIFSHSSSELSTDAVDLRAIAAKLQSETPSDELSLRLPDDLMPESYKLRIRSYLPSPDAVVTYLPEKNFTFDGWVEIMILCVKPTKVLMLNSMDLNFTESTFDFWRIEGESPIERLQLAEEIQKLPEQQMVKFTLNQPLTENSRYQFRINYTGPIRDDLSGYYRSSYLEHGITRWLGATQFEPTSARKALPCFDEPAFKATFEMIMEHPSDMVALFNSPEISRTQLRNGWTSTSFSTTPKMSSYLLAFVTARFAPNYSYTQDRSVKFGAWSRPSQKNSTNYAKEIGPAILKFYETYFGVKFPLTKTDQIALPDFKAGAMENWGLITYDEQAMLYNPDTNALKQKFRATIVMSHEISHMWFGNLVTIKWWDDLWLKEGFATYLQYIGGEHIYSGGHFWFGNLVTIKWWDDLWLKEGFATYLQYIGGEHIYSGGHFFEQFPARVIRKAMDSDQLSTAHPLRVPVRTVEDALANFDSISYSKGASVLQMLNYTIGEELFRKGVNNYLEKFAYKTTVHDDLWASMNEVASDESAVKGWNGEPIEIKEFMDRWVLQAGFPVVTISKKEANGTTVLSLNQSRFTLVGNTTHNPKYPDLGYDYQWYVPIWYQTGSKTDQIQFAWLKPHSTASVELMLEEEEWYLINPDARGYYRVNYDLDNWMRIQRQLAKNHSVFSVRTRSQLMSDIFNLAATNKVSYSEALKLSQYLKEENSDVPWGIARLGINVIRTMLESHPNYPIVQKYFLSLVKPHYDRISWNGIGLDVNDLLDMNFYTNVISDACGLDDADCTTEAMNQFQQFMTSCLDGVLTCPSKITTDLREIVYCVAVRKGNQSIFDYVFQRFENEIEPPEKERFLKGLACASTAELKNRLIETAVGSESNLRVKESLHLMKDMAHEKDGAQFVLDSLLNTWDMYKQRFPTLYLGLIIKEVASGLTTSDQVQQLSELISTHEADFGESKVVFEGALETAKSNVLWKQRNAEEILNWISNHFSEDRQSSEEK